MKLSPVSPERYETNCRAVAAGVYPASAIAWTSSRRTSSGSAISGAKPRGDAGPEDPLSVR
jgi:hypothetical protein